MQKAIILLSDDEGVVVLANPPALFELWILEDAEVWRQAGGRMGGSAR